MSLCCWTSHNFQCVFRLDPNKCSTAGIHTGWGGSLTLVGQNIGHMLTPAALSRNSRKSVLLITIVKVINRFTVPRGTWCEYLVFASKTNSEAVCLWTSQHGYMHSENKAVYMKLSRSKWSEYKVSKTTCTIGKNASWFFMCTGHCHCPNQPPAGVGWCAHDPSGTDSTGSLRSGGKARNFVDPFRLHFSFSLFSSNIYSLSNFVGFFLLLFLFVKNGVLTCMFKYSTRWVYICIYVYSFEHLRSTY